MNLTKQDEGNGVDFFGFYHLLNQYILISQRDQVSNRATKQNSMTEVGFKLGRSAIEKISENCIEKFKEDPMAKGVQVIKFICKEFWNYFFLRNVDRLEGSKQGTYCLFINSFIMFDKLSPVDSPEKQEFIELWYALVKGLVKGAIKGLAYNADVSVEPQKESSNQNQQIPMQIGSFQVSINISNVVSSK